MQIERKIAVVFSATGSTKKTVEALSPALGGFDAVIDITPHEAGVGEAFGEGDLVVFAVPSFGGRVPAPAAEKMRGLSGNGAAAAVLTVYGNRHYDDTLAEMADIVRDGGFAVVASGAFLAEHSIMHKVAAGRPDAQDIAALEEFGQALAGKLEAADGAATADAFDKVPGNRPYCSFGGVPFKPRATRLCTKCGRCAPACPVAAIPEERPDETNAEACISCMRCIAVCPFAARTIKGFKLTAASMAFAKKCAQRRDAEWWL